MEHLLQDLNLLQTRIDSNILDDPYRLYSAYSDFFPEKENAKQNLKIFLEEDFLTITRQLTKSEEVDSAISQLVSFNVKKSDARILVHTFCDLLKINIQEEKIKISNPVYSARQAASQTFTFTKTTKKENIIRSLFHKINPKFIPIILSALTALITIVYFSAPIQAYLGVQKIVTGEASQYQITESLDRLPLGSTFFHFYLKKEIRSVVEDYNNETLSYPFALRQISILRNDDISEYTDEQICLLNELKSSMIAYRKGVSNLEKKNYLTAIKSLNSVIESDKNYKSAQALLKQNQNTFQDTIIEEINMSINAGEYDEVQEYAVIGMENSKDQQFQEIMNTAILCGNPYIYHISKQICDNFKKIEKDKNNKSEPCYKLLFFNLDDTHFLLGAQFGITAQEEDSISASDYSIVCYQITADKLKKISEKKYRKLLTQYGTTEKLTVDWNSQLSSSEKQEKIYQELLKLGPCYTGAKDGLSIITDDEDTGSVPKGWGYSIKSFISLLFRIIFYGVLSIFALVMLFHFLSYLLDKF